MLNLRLPISLTGLLVAAVVLSGYHFFVEPLVPATSRDLFLIAYVTSALNLYGFYFKFRSLVSPSAYWRTYDDVKEMAGWTYNKIRDNYRDVLRKLYEAMKNDPMITATVVSWAIAVLFEGQLGTVAWIPLIAVFLVVLGREVREIVRESGHGSGDTS